MAHAGKPRRGDSIGRTTARFSPFKVRGRQPSPEGSAGLNDMYFLTPFSSCQAGRPIRLRSNASGIRFRSRQGRQAFRRRKRRPRRTPQIVSRETIRQADFYKRLHPAQKRHPKTAQVQGGNLTPRNAAAEPLPVQQASGTVRRTEAPMHRGRHPPQPPMLQYILRCTSRPPRKAPTSSVNASRKGSAQSPRHAAHPRMHNAPPRKAARGSADGSAKSVRRHPSHPGHRGTFPGGGAVPRAKPPPRSLRTRLGEHPAGKENRQKPTRICAESIDKKTDR